MSVVHEMHKFTWTHGGTDTVISLSKVIGVIQNRNTPLEYLVRQRKLIFKVVIREWHFVLVMTTYIL